MPSALLALAAAALLPYLTVALAKFGGGGYDNASPRASLDALHGWRARADWAHRNHFEAFPPFAAAVLAALLAHAPPGPVALAAWAFVGLRVAYTAAYVADRPTLRSALWALAAGCVGWLFWMAVRAG